MGDEILSVDGEVVRSHSALHALRLRSPIGRATRVLSDDDTLAIALAHAFAHAIWERPDRSRLARERQADLLGTELAARAGFDVGGTVAYWEAVARAHPELVLPPDPDPEIDQLNQLLRGLTFGFPQLHDGLAMRMDGIRRAVEGARRLLRD